MKPKPGISRGDEYRVVVKEMGNAYWPFITIDRAADFCKFLLTSGRFGKTCGNIVIRHFVNGVHRNKDVDVCELHC